MFWSVVGRVLWARRAILIIATLACLAGGVVILTTSAPRYDATARVMLNVLKPDPITGSRISSRQLDPYIQSQLKMIRDTQVVGPAIEAVGWLDNPDLIAAYDARPPGDPRDFPTWVTARVIAALQVRAVQDSNIVEITFRGASPELAVVVASAIRDAYISTSIRQRRESAAGTADIQRQVADQIARELGDLRARKAAMERATGIVLQDGGGDVETARLRYLAKPLTPPPKSAFQAQSFIARSALAKLDSELAAATAELGPSHPKVLQMREKRVGLALSAAEEARFAENVGGVVAAQERATAVEVERQKEKVLSQRQELLKLRLLLDQINLKEKAYSKINERIANLRQLAATEESGLSAVGEVEAETSPAYPNAALILGGTAGFGLLAGLLLALMVELLNLRIRTTAGLRVASRLPVLGTIPSLSETELQKAPRGRRWRLLRADPKPS